MAQSKVEIKVVFDPVDAVDRIRELRDELDALNRAMNDKKWWQFWKRVKRTSDGMSF